MRGKKLCKKKFLIIVLILLSFIFVIYPIDNINSLMINHGLYENIIDNQQINFNNSFENRIISIPLISNKTITVQNINSFDIDIIDVNESFIILFATDEQIEFLTLKGFEPKILYNNYNEMMGFDRYPEMLYSFHDYTSMTSELQTIASTYPTITNLSELGQSVQGRSIWGLKISDNPNVEENEVELRFCGAHHGNEYMSVEIPLLFAWDLVQNYTIDPEITDLIDNREIWIIPMVNPDGRQMGQRRNANNVDLNRDYGYMWNGAGSSPSPFSQPETQTIREHALDNNIVLSYSYHTTAQYVNYVWNYKPQPTPDEPWIIMISDVYGDLSGYQPINGFDWYQTTGDTNDFSYGCYGGIDTTIETLNSNIQSEWNRNRDAMYYALNISDMGLSGIVTDAITGNPIQATIWVEENYWPVYNDPVIGDYHKPLFEGSYNVSFRANGYQEQIKNITITNANESNILNASLFPSDDYYGYQVTMCEYFSYTTNPSEGISALGPPDNISASIGTNGMIVIDMGNNSEIFDGTGDDFTVYEADNNSEGYIVSVSNNWSGPWSIIGSGLGTSSFDLESVELTTARFVKIEDDGVTMNTKDYPGFDLDAIKILNVNSSNELPIANFTYSPINPTTNDIIQFTDISTDSDGSIVSWYWDFGDGNISNIQNTSHSYQEKGMYSVSLLITDDDGDFDTKIIDIYVNNFGPNADFLYLPSNPLKDEIIYFTDGSYDTSGDNISTWYWEFGDNVTSYLQNPTHNYSLNGSYKVNLTVTNSTGIVDSVSKTIYVGFINVDISLSSGWNLITIPPANGWWASDIAENVSGCTSVVKWNPIEQSYWFYIPGYPVFDFPLTPGEGYFVEMDNADTLSMVGLPVTNVNITLKEGWNIIGWYQNQNTTASSIAENISGCLSVVKWNPVEQSYWFYIPGYPIFDFAITSGMGIFVEVDQDSYWYG
jgi:PKD repeat protein